MANVPVGLNVDIERFTYVPETNRLFANASKIGLRRGDMTPGYIFVKGKTRLVQFNFYHRTQSSGDDFIMYVTDAIAGDLSKNGLPLKLQIELDILK